MARAPADEPDSKLSDSTRGFNSLSALASTARVGSPQTIQGHARPGLKMTSCLNGRRDGVQVFVVQHLPQPGRSFQPHTAKPSCIWGGFKNTEWEFWPRCGRCGGQQKGKFAMHRLPADGPGRSVGMAGHVLEMGKAAPQFCAAKSSWLDCWNQWNGTNGTGAQHSTAPLPPGTARRG